MSMKIIWWAHSLNLQIAECLQAGGYIDTIAQEPNGRLVLTINKDEQVIPYSAFEPFEKETNGKHSKSLREWWNSGRMFKHMIGGKAKLFTPESVTLKAKISETLKKTITCQKCGYTWGYKGKLPMVTCPSCGYKTKA